MPWYHEVESVALENGQLIITTDNGSLLISADEKTQLFRYEGEGAVSLKEIFRLVIGSWPGTAP